MKGLFTYYGGKSTLSSRIAGLLPPHTVYVEPFAGGASVFWAKGLPKVKNAHYYREVLNDTNGALVSAYRAIQRHPDDVLQRVLETPYSYREYLRAIEIYNSPEEHDIVDVAWAVLVNSRMSFSGKMSAGWSTSTKGQARPKTWTSAKMAMESFFSRLSSVFIDDRDAIECIAKWDSPQTVFYCDPPYPGSHQGHYGGYTQDDFRGLVDALGAARGSFVLSNYDNDYVPEWWTRETFDVQISARLPSAGSVKDESWNRRECVWVVNRSEGVPEDLVSRLWSPATVGAQMSMF